MDIKQINTTTNLVLDAKMCIIKTFLFVIIITTKLE